MEEAFTDDDMENLDLTQVPAIQQKRTLAFVNHFIVSTVQFLNNFLKTCEFKLMKFERKLDKVEAATVLLEARLSSIPELNTVKSVEKVEVTTAPVEPAETSPLPTAELPLPTKELCLPTGELPLSTADLPPEEPNISSDYLRFVKMVQVGVPLEAVKLKARVEGLNPDVLDKCLKK